MLARQIDSIGRIRTFLSFMEDWRTGMVDAILVLVGVHLATALVHAFLGHG
jgi:cytochrome b561